MTNKECVKQILDRFEFKEENSGIDALVAYAYYLGRCEVAKELCDKVSNIFEQQINRANQCRYHEMAKTVQGNIKNVYHSDYDQWINIFDNDIVELFREHLCK